MDASINELDTIIKYAEEENVPIIEKESIDYLQNFIIKNEIKSILEIGSAIGYSAIMMARCSDDVKIVTIERDQDRYMEALKNIKQFDLEDRITLVFNDALETNIEESFDLIFIDAAKGQNINFFEKFELNLNENGYIITDNMKFHGMVDKNPEEIESRNVRQLVRKIIEYKEFLLTKEDYEVEFLDIGDGLAVARRISEDNG